MKPDFVVGHSDGRMAVILGRGGGSIASDRLFNVSSSISRVALSATGIRDCG
jgi:hypothetical protein